MGHDIYLETEQWGQLYYCRFPCWVSKVTPHFYCVYDAQHCYKWCSGNGESISLHRHNLKRLRILYACHSSQDWGFDETEKKLAIQIDASVYAIEKYFDKHPPSLADETYFLIKQLPLPESLVKRVAAYSSEDKARVTVDFR